MVNKYLSQMEAFLHFDRNVFYVWNVTNSLNIKYHLKVTYEPYILKIDDQRDIIAILIESREYGQEIIVFKINQSQNTLNLQLKCPTLSRAYDIKLTKNNSILLIDMIRLYEYDIQKRKYIKLISFVEPYFDQQIVRRYFSDSPEDFVANSKMLTRLNGKNQYVNIVQKPYELLVRIFSLNPFYQDDNFVGIYLVKSNFFEVIEKNTFITNQLKDNTIIIFRYDPRERHLKILLRTPIFFMNSLKYIPESNLLLNITLGSKQICVDIFKIKIDMISKANDKKYLTSLNKENNNDMQIEQDQKAYLHLYKVERKDNPSLSENFSDLCVITQNRTQLIGFINESNSKFSFITLINLEAIFRIDSLQKNNSLNYSNNSTKNPLCQINLNH